MLQTDEQQRLETVVRALAAATKTLRLYPPTSPIPRQSVATTMSALSEYFTGGSPVLALAVGRDGFTRHGSAIGNGVPGVSDLADGLREHGVAELAIMPGTQEDELLAFLVAVSMSPADVRAEGGLGALLATKGVEALRVTDVVLTVLEEQVGPGEDEDFDDFLRALIADPVKLAHWFAAASAGDPATFGESLMELKRVAGTAGYEMMLNSLSSAFLAQSADGKDALLGLALDAGPVRSLTGGVFAHLGANDIAGAVIGGTFGKNMLSLSNALTHLPLEQVTAQVRAEVQAMLPGAGHTSKEATFLDHMIEVRSAREPEPALVDASGTYRAVADASKVSDDDMARARGAVTASAGVLNAAGVRTMLALLDQQRDADLYYSGADNLAAMVPKLIEQGDLSLASKVVTELVARQSASTSPWPELAGRLRAAVETAVGPRAMSALVGALVADRTKVPVAHDLIRHASDAGARAFVAEAITRKEDGLAAADEVLGRRLVDLLVAEAGSAQWFQLAPVVARLAAEQDPRSLQVLEQLMRRPDEQSRREVATGLARTGGPAASRLLALALKDPSSEVAIVAARAIGRSGTPGSGGVLAARLAELDIDGDGFTLAREMIAALARVPDAEAAAALNKLASRRALIKRGHFAEVQDLVQQALQLRAHGGGAR
jgi:hypothetical protein